MENMSFLNNLRLGLAFLGASLNFYDRKFSKFFFYLRPLHDRYTTVTPQIHSSTRYSGILVIKTWYYTTFFLQTLLRSANLLRHSPTVTAVAAMSG